ncbi:hypothetical protein J6590_019532 [Homalodisca vitripennis]|nr:hypothetical protein J6590_019532 [Homalodisca vitripennis]
MAESESISCFEAYGCKLQGQSEPAALPSFPPIRGRHTLTTWYAILGEREDIRRSSTVEKRIGVELSVSIPECGYNCFGYVKDDDAYFNDKERLPILRRIAVL